MKPAGSLMRDWDQFPLSAVSVSLSATPLFLSPFF